MNEIWKDIPNYEGLYQVSNFGRIKKLNKKMIVKQENRTFIYHSKERMLKPQKEKTGYFNVVLYNATNKKHFKVHRLVAEAFIPNPENKPQVNHIDGNKQNNCVSNLEFCTNGENQIHAWGTGLQKRYIGKENPKSKKVKQFDINNKYIKTWDCIREVERTLKIKNYNITSCCKGKRKTAGGYIWRYANERR